eukprot:9478049-Pyramimonas_sp.AAC.2
MGDLAILTLRPRGVVGMQGGSLGSAPAEWNCLSPSLSLHFLPEQWLCTLRQSTLRHEAESLPHAESMLAPRATAAIDEPDELEAG